jgi:hypothetical protein
MLSAIAAVGAAVAHILQRLKTLVRVPTRGGDRSSEEVSVQFTVFLHGFQDLHLLEFCSRLYSTCLCSYPACILVLH